MANPVSIRGVSYLLYPVYEARGICLYFIGKSAGGVRLAVVLPKHLSPPGLSPFTPLLSINRSRQRESNPHSQLGRLELYH